MIDLWSYLNWRRLAFLAVCWGSSIAVAVLYYSSRAALDGVQRTPALDVNGVSVCNNEIGSFAAWRCDPKANHRPLYLVTFENLRAENGQLGLFKTAAHKIVKIQDLRMELYRYAESTPSALTQPFPETIYDALLAAENSSTSGETLRCVLSQSNSKYRKSPFPIDVSNTTEVRVSDFTYKLFDNGAIFVAVTCKRASVSLKSPEIVLQGHATITIADGSTLESNYIRWDPQKRCFVAFGGYVLNREGARTIGRNICVDDKLNATKEQTRSLGVRSNENG
jgi:hypothetical protein